MEANEINLLTAPQLVTRAWWGNLDKYQKIFLAAFVVLYLFATLLTSSIVIVDKIYDIKLKLTSFIKGHNKVTTPYNLSLTIMRGFWRTEKVLLFPDNTQDLSTKELENHLQIGSSLWDKCQVMSYRGTPCESAGVFFTLLGTLLFYYHCTTFVLFRVMAILNLSLGAFLVMIGFGLMFASAQEYLYCLSVLNSEKYGRTGYFSGRKFSSTLSMDTVNFKLIMTTEFLMLLPMIIIGIYLLVFKRNNL